MANPRVNLLSRVVRWPIIPDPASVPEGRCHCGCGGETGFASRPDYAIGRLKGQRYRYLNGHASRKGWAYKTDPVTGCWNWLCGKRHGYGVAYLGYKNQFPSHKLFFELCYGTVPESLELDHLCRNRGCVNPNHVQPVTHTVNVRRGANPKLTMELAEQIRALSAHGFSERQVARLVGVTRWAVRPVIKGITWKKTE